MLSYHLRQEYEEELASLGTNLYDAHKEHNEYYTLQKLQNLDPRIKERMVELEESWTRCRRLVMLKARINDAEKQEGNENERLVQSSKREQRSKRIDQHRRWRGVQVKKTSTVTVCAGQSSSHVKEAMNRLVKKTTASRVQKMSMRKNKVDKDINSLTKATKAKYFDHLSTYTKQTLNHTQSQFLFKASKAPQKVYKRFEQYKRWTKSQALEADSVKIVVDNLPSGSDFADSMSTQTQQEKMSRPIPCFTIVSKPLHCALNWSEDTVDRLTDEYNQNRLMSREQHQNLVGSIDKIHKYMQETIPSGNTQDILYGLEKLFNGGHISKYQQKTYIARYKLTSG